MDSAAPPTAPTTTAPPAAGTATPTAGTALDPRLYTDPELLAAEQQLIFERTWQLAGHVKSLPETGELPDRAGRHPAGARRARRRQPAARVQERLPPPRIAAAQRLGPVQGGDPLPLPRLDLPARRLADRDPRGPVIRREGRQAQVRADAGARRGDVRAGVRQPRPRRDAAGRARRRPARSGWRRTGSRRSSSSRRAPAPSRPTGRSSPTTTSRATTSRSPIRD